MNKCILSFYVAFVSMIILLTTFSAFAGVRLPQLVSNHMVLQRNMNINIWGWALPGEKVSIRFNGKIENTVTGSDHNWMVRFPAMHAGGPYTMIIKGKNEIILSDILIGDVWFCSGQSNMVLPMERIKEKYPDEVANDSFPEIRNFFVPTVLDVTSVHEDLPPG
jgi:sialate O-acetylesterase